MKEKEEANGEEQDDSKGSGSRLANKSSFRMSGGLSPTDASIRIARFWKRRARGHSLLRKQLISRLMLEDALWTGLFRLVAFIVLFVMLLNANSHGTPSSERLAISSMLDNTLDMDTFNGIAGLEGTRNFLPQLSENFKVYSASSSLRYPDPESMRIISSEVCMMPLHRRLPFKPIPALTSRTLPRQLRPPHPTGPLHFPAFHGLATASGRSPRVYPLCLGARGHLCSARPDLFPHPQAAGFQ
jgi:hypothetical protein